MVGTQGLPRVDGSLLWSRASVPFAHPQNSSRPRPSCLELGPLASGSRAGGRPHLPGAPSTLACAPRSEGRGEVTSHPQAVHLGMGREGEGSSGGFLEFGDIGSSLKGHQNKQREKGIRDQGFPGAEGGTQEQGRQESEASTREDLEAGPQETRLRGGEAPRSRL